MMSEDRTIIVGQTYLGPDHCVYRVVGIAKNVATHNMMVVYEEHFGEHRMFVMDYSEFAAPNSGVLRGAEILYLYRMNECIVDHDGKVFVSPCCVRQKEENNNG